jgi:chromosome segregation ATPase
MPRKQQFRPQDKTLDQRFLYNPYFYNKCVNQNDNNIKYNACIRDLRLNFRNLRKKNLALKNQLKLKTKEADELRMLTNLQSESLELLKSENDTQKKTINKLKQENSNLKAENQKLKEQINTYVNAINLYRNEMTMKISGRVKLEFDSYFLNFNYLIFDMLNVVDFLTSF